MSGQSSKVTNPDGATAIAAKVPICGNDKNVVSAIMATNTNAAQKMTSGTIGVSIDNVDKMGAGLNVAHTPAFKQTDYSATGKVNVFRSDTSSFDLSVGATKSVSPMIPKSNWEPTANFTFKKQF